MFLVGTGERIHIKNLVDRSQQIMIGASEDDVLKTLGDPRSKWAARGGFFFSRPEQWIYGSSFNPDHLFILGLPFPNPLPITLRLFSPDAEDLVVEWTSKQKVANIRRPDLTIPHGSEKFLEPIYFVVDVISLFQDERK